MSEVQRSPAEWIAHRVAPRLEATELWREAPDREIRLGALAIAVSVFALVVWGAGARLDAGAVAPAEVIVYGNRQAVQNREGGVVRALHVHEGDHVAAGQLLIALDGVDLDAAATSLRSQIIDQETLQARLRAELAGREVIDFPAALPFAEPQDQSAVALAEQTQRLELARRDAALASERQVLSHQTAQSAEQMSGLSDQAAANRRQRMLIEQELGGLQSLYRDGLVPATRMRQLQQSEAELDGTLAQYHSSRAAAGQEISEKRARKDELLSERGAEDAKDLQTSQEQLGELVPKLSGLQHQLAETQVRAPAGGQVVGLTVSTVGGVISPGQRLMEIVPDHPSLLISARVKPTDIDGVREGQRVEVRLNALHDRGLPTAFGVVKTVSADTLSDDKTGEPYFRVDVVLPPHEIARLARRGPADIRAGAPASVVIPLRARSAFDYLLEPLNQVLWAGFHQR